MGKIRKSNYNIEIEDLTQAIKLFRKNNDKAIAYNNRGNAKFWNSDYDGAIVDYTSSIELKPDYADAFYNRANANERLGKTKKAADDRKKAKELEETSGGKK